MAREKKTTEAVSETQAIPTIELTGNVNVPLEIREEIMKKAEALKAEHKLRKFFVVIVEGDEGIDDKPLYIAYFRRPSLMHFSQYMNFVQKDVVQASKMLATNTFLDGDRALVDDDELFLYGAMAQLPQLIESRNADLVKK